MPENRAVTNHAQNEKSPRRSFGPGGGRRVSGERANNFSKAIGDLMGYCRKYLPAIVIAVVSAAAGSILNLIGPGKVADMTNLITQGMMGSIDVEAVVRIAALLVCLYGLGWLFSVIQGVIMATVTQRVSKSLRTDISQKINRLPLRYFDQTSTGNILSRVTNDVDTIGQTLNQSVGTLVTASTMFVGSLVMMFYTNAVMAISAVLAAIVGFGLMMLIISHSQKFFRKQQQELGALNGHIEETYSGHSVVKAYNGEKAAKEEFHRMNQQLYQCAWKSQFMSGLMQPLMGFVGNLGYVAVCVTGAVLTMNGIISFSVIVAFMLYVRLFTQPLSQLAQAATSLQSAAAASERVFDFLGEAELEDESKKSLQLTRVAGNVEFEHIRFGYDEGKAIIHDFSASVKAGQKIAIVGPTGAGKTTLVNLLMRFYETQGGNIRIDGTAVQHLTRENIHNLFGMVLQDTWIFEGTVKENIIYSKANVTEEQVIAACKAVGLHHFIKTLPQRYDTVLNENANLSAGQRQLVTIARAMIEDAPMLILDEATSSVDTRTEILIQNAMDKLMAGRTSFVIAHRLSTIKNADMILVMKDGDIIESGTHEKLLAKGGFYAELYNSQFEIAS